MEGVFMFQQLGSIIRTVREQKGLGLNQLAKQLEVSSGYLSNLERGKTETVPLSFLDKLENELHISMFSNTNFTEQEYSEIDIRLNRCCHQLKELSKSNPEYASYLISTIESGIQFAEKHFINQEKYH